MEIAKSDYVTDEKADALRARLTGLTPGETPKGWLALFALLGLRVGFRRSPPK